MFLQNYGYENIVTLCPNLTFLCVQFYILYCAKAVHM